MTSSTLDALASTSTEQRKLLFKCEHLQRIGAFKIRGAMNAVLQLSPEQLEHGVVTHSSGNHAQALALAAREAKSSAFVVMPSTSPQVKKDAVAGYGAQVTECPPTLADRERTAQEIVDRTGATFIHPYNDPRVMAGQGTQMLELLEQAAESGHAPLDAVLVPVGGGGMLSGCATVAKALSPGTRVFGCEPILAADAAESLKTGIRQPQRPPVSCADGLLTALGENGFAVIQQHVDAIFTVTEEEIIRAMNFVWERMKQVIEPSGAVGVAVALYNKEFRALQGIDNVGVILCGGNVQLDRAAALFASL
ncbi:serine racemase, partial [Protomyces lactucae-debilis]